MRSTRENSGAKLRERRWIVMLALSVVVIGEGVLFVRAIPKVTRPRFEPPSARGIATTRDAVFRDGDGDLRLARDEHGAYVGHSLRYDGETIDPGRLVTRRAGFDWSCSYFPPASWGPPVFERIEIRPFVWLEESAALTAEERDECVRLLSRADFRHRSQSTPPQALRGYINGFRFRADFRAGGSSALCVNVMAPLRWHVAWLLWVVPAVLLPVGLYGLGRSVVLAHSAPAERRARLGLCVGCGYDVRGLRSSACPECGRVLDDEA